MILPRSIVLGIGILLAVVEAVQQYLGLAGYVHAIVAMAVIFLGSLGVHALSPGTIKGLIPLHLATVLAALVAALNTFQQFGIAIPRIWHVVIGVVLVIAATLGITVPAGAAVRGVRTGVAAPPSV